jgi:two-component system, OmpR family, response regulator CssR
VAYLNYSIYLVEDEENLNLLLKSYLEKEGWKVKSFLTGEEAMNFIDDKPHLWILDIMLPDIDGFQLITEIKKNNSNLPVIFISARDSDLDRIVGLEKGSDDYLAKPFSPRELVIRAHKLLTRVYKKDNLRNIFLYKIYRIYTDKRIVINDKEEEILLTSKEFDILQYFLENIQLALSREQILNAIWEKDFYGTDRVIDDLVRRLRKKLPILKIETIYGYGYRLVKP